VIDGARRLYAVKALKKDGRWEADAVPCTVISNGLDSLEYSLHGNLHMAMHPLDEADAIAKLSKRDEDKTTIAARFGRTTTWVDQRARLSLLIPEVKHLFREREIDLEGAMAFTLADAKLQKQIVKAHQYDSPAQIRRMATQQKVNAKEAIFPLTDWPTDKIERDLFSDDVWLTSIPLFLKKQAEAFEQLAASYKTKGYHEVVIVKPDDWQTVNRYAAVKGKITDKTIGRLSVLLQLRADGKVQVWENMIPNKQSKKVQPSASGPDKADAEDIVTKKAKDLTQLQDEEVCAQGAAALFMHLVEGDPKESLIQYIVYSVMCTVQKEPWVLSSQLGVNGKRRWEQVMVNHKVEQGVRDTQLPDGMTYDKWMTTRTAGARKQLFTEAVARMVAVPHQGGMAMAKTLPVRNWFKPTEAFFGRWNGDQLREYLKRSGLAVEADKPLKKAELVKLAFERSQKPGAWQLGLAG
jgi:hypothetical protein